MVFHILSCTMAFCGWKISRISPVIDFLISVKYQHSWYSPLEGYFTDITNKSHYLQARGPGVAVKQYSQSFTYKKDFTNIWFLSLYRSWNREMLEANVVMDLWFWGRHKLEPCGSEVMCARPRPSIVAAQWAYIALGDW